MIDTAIILLATYNGVRFLREQLESLLTQTHKNVRILIRDDGSHDGTLKILSEYASAWPHLFEIMQGPNLGFVGNFLALIAAAPLDAAAYFFCDQDDVWLPGKVSRALDRLQKAQGPAMVFSRLAVVDVELKPLNLSPLISRWSLGNALFESQVTGCTLALNRAGFQVLRDVRPEAQKIVAHDWWIYLCLNAFGTLIYDEEPQILYRQHSSNSIGTPRTRWEQWSLRWRNFRTGRSAKRRPEPMVAHFLQIYGSRLQPHQVQLIESASLLRAGFWSPLRLFLQGAIWRRGPVNQSLLFLMLLVPSLRKPAFHSLGE